jgi:hypothetical protein
VEDYTVNIGGAAIASFAGRKYAIELGNEDSIYDFNMYPNPTSSVLNIKMTDSRAGTYRMMNYVGQEVDAGKLSDMQLNVSKLAAGAYILEINDGQKLLTKQFIKK